MGLPDYRRQTTTSYGKAARATRATGAASVGLVDIANITGRGIIYGGYILASNTISDTTRQRDRIVVTQDGTEIFNVSVQNMALRGLSEPGPAPVFVIMYGEENYNYRFGVSPGFTFDSSWRLQYQVVGTDLDVLLGEVHYALAG